MNQRYSSNSMPLIQAIDSRRSVRGFTQEPVSDSIIEQILEIANKAPSNCNIQPWYTYVATGESTQALGKLLVAATQQETPNADYPSPMPFPEPYRRRQVDCAVELYNQMGIARNDKDKRTAAALRNFSFFDAPQVLFIGMDKRFGTSVALDVGMYAQNLMLTMTAFGLGSCAQGALRQYPQIIRDFFNIDDDIGILMGLSFGYEDSACAANNTKVGRAPYTQQLRWKK